MATDIDFSDRRQVQRWLANKPREIAVVFAARTALRAAPLLAGLLGPRGGAARAGRDIVLPVFRAMAAPWVAGQYPTHGAGTAARAADAAYAAAASVTAHYDAVAYDVAIDARAAAEARAEARTAAHAAFAAYHAARAAAADHAAALSSEAAARAALSSDAADAARAAYAACDADAQIIDGVSASALAARPLWLTEIPDWAHDGWQRLEQALLRENEDWRVWTDWYRARLEGRPANEALEVARVLIADEIWSQGPRAVNAEIARLIEQHRPRMASTDDLAALERLLRYSEEEALRLGVSGVVFPPSLTQPQKKPPDVPAQSAAAIQPLWRGHLLTLPAQHAAQDLSEVEFMSALAVLRDDLREFADDLSGEANIDKRFLSYVRRFADRIPQAPPSQNELFRLGHVEEVFVAYAKTVDSEWPDFLSVRYHALMLQCERTMRQSPLWRSFKRNAAEQALTAGQIVAATPLATVAANALREAEAPEFVDAAVPTALDELSQTLQPLSGHAETPLDAVEAGTELLAADLIESVNNVLKPIAEAALTAAVVAGKALGEAGKTLAEAGQDYAVGVGKGLRKAAKREGPKDGERAFKWLRRLAIAGTAGAGAAGTGVFAELSQLIAKFPQAFEWLERVLHFIK